MEYIFVIGLLILIIWCIFHVILADAFYDIADMKGHSEKRYWHFCFWLGLPGWLMVIALPDRYSTNDVISHRGTLTDNHTISPQQDKYDMAVALMNKKQYYLAIKKFIELGNYLDCKERVVQCKYEGALDYMERGNYGSAIQLFSSLGDFMDSKENLMQCKYFSALTYMDKGEYLNAIYLFDELGNYVDSKEKLAECKAKLSNKSAT